MGPGQKFLTRVGSGQPPMNLENFPPKTLIFSIFFPSDQKKYWVGSKNTRVKDWFAPYLLVKTQKYAWVGACKFSKNGDSTNQIFGKNGDSPNFQSTNISLNCF